MEVVWRGPAELSPRRPVFDMKKKRAWGVDAHKVVQLMMGQLQSADNCTAAMPCYAGADDNKTLDLLGGESVTPGAAASLPNIIDDNGTSTDFLELEPEQPRLSSDWKKCLDLKTGKVSFVNKTTGVTWEKYGDLRKVQPLDVGVPSLATLEPMTSPASLRAHEFLRSKKSETLCEESLRTSSSSSSGGSPRKTKSRDRLQLVSFLTGTQLWNLHLEDTNVSLVKDSLQLAEDLQEETSNLELDLNLTTGGGGSPASSCHQREQSVCTMEMVQRALRRTADQGLDRKRSELPTAALTRLSAASPSFSSLSSARSHEPVWSLGSPSTSSSSAISSRSPRLDGTQTPVLQDDLQQASKIVSTGVIAGDSAEIKKKPGESMATSTTTALVMGACTRCLMYLMLDKSNPKCPRCGTDALVDFAPMTPTTNAAVKRQRVQ